MTPLGELDTGDPANGLAQARSALSWLGRHRHPSRGCLSLLI